MKDLHSLSKQGKDEIVSFVREAVEQKIAEFGDQLNVNAACLHHAVSFQKIVGAMLDKGSQTRVIINAGSCQWPRLREDQDDGNETTLTHFTYLFDKEKADANLLAILTGILPEIHVWNVILTPGQFPVIVDLTTRYLMEQCAKLNMDWPGDKPPDYIWCPWSELPPRVHYMADEQACLLVKLALELHRF